MSGSAAEAVAGILARVRDEGLDGDVQQIERLLVATERLKAFARLNRLGEDAFGEPAVVFVPTVGGARSDG